MGIREMAISGMLYLLVLLPLGVSGQDTARVDTLRLTMSQAVEMALADNLSIKATESKQTQSLWANREKWGGLLPTLSAKANYTRNLKKPVIFLPEDSPMGMMGGGTIEIGSDNSYSAGLTATMPLFAMPMYRGIAISRIDQAIAKEDLRGAKVNLKGDVEAAFVGLLMARDSHGVMGESMRSAQMTLDNVTRLAKQGMVAEYDLIRAKVQVSNLRPAYVQTAQAVEAAELALRALLNLEAERAIVPVGSLDELAEGISLLATMGGHPTAQAEDSTRASGHRDTLLASNTVLRNMRLQEDKLRYQHKMLKDTHLPTLSAVFNWQYMTQSNSFEFGNYRWVNTSMVGLQLNVPIFAGFTTVSKSQQLRIGQMALALQRDYTAQQLEVKAAVAKNQMLAARESMEASKAGIALAKRGVKIARTRYNGGSGTLIELNDAEMASTNAQLNYNKAVYAYIKAYVDYRKTLGVE